MRPDGSALRPARPADAAAIHRVVRRIEVEDRIPLVTPVEELEEWADDPHLAFATDTRVVEQGGAVVGYGRTWHRPGDAAQERVFLLGGVDPAWRGRGIGRAIFAWQLARGREILEAAPAGLRRFLRTQAFDFERGAIALYERHGLAPARFVDELVRPLDELPPVPRVDGVSIAPWDPARHDILREVHNEGFAGQASTTALDAAAWAHHVASAGNRLDLSVIATQGDDVVGLSLNAQFPDDEGVTGRRDGWIRQLATRGAHRRRGIGGALLLASCHAFRRAGLTHAMLGVDSDNPSGAYHLYERNGFRRLHRSIQHQLEVSDAMSSSNAHQK